MVKLDDFIKEFRVFAKAVLGRLDRHERQINMLSREVKDLKVQNRYDWQGQREFNKRIEKKVDLLDDSVKALDKRVRYQEDMPERLEKIENDTY